MVIENWIDYHHTIQKAFKVTLIVSVCIYSVIFIGYGYYALKNWPEQLRQIGPKNRKVTQEIAQDLKNILAPGETFVYMPAYGYPKALQYYMLDKNGNYPEYVDWNGTDSFSTIKPFIENRVSQCKVILVYEEDIEKVSKLVYFQPRLIYYYRAVADWIKEHKDHYNLVKTYNLYNQTGPALTIQLYIRKGP